MKSIFILVCMITTLIQWTSGGELKYMQQQDLAATLVKSLNECKLLTDLSKTIGKPYEDLLPICTKNQDQLKYVYISVNNINLEKDGNGDEFTVKTTEKEHRVEKPPQISNDELQVKVDEFNTKDLGNDNEYKVAQTIVEKQIECELIRSEDKDTCNHALNCLKDDFMLKHNQKLEDYTQTFPITYKGTEVHINSPPNIARTCNGLPSEISERPIGQSPTGDVESISNNHVSVKGVRNALSNNYDEPYDDFSDLETLEKQPTKVKKSPSKMVTKALPLNSDSILPAAGKVAISMAVPALGGGALMTMAASQVAPVLASYIINCMNKETSPAEANKKNEALIQLINSFGNGNNEKPPGESGSNSNTASDSNDVYTSLVNVITQNGVNAVLARLGVNPSDPLVKRFLTNNIPSAADLSSVACNIGNWASDNLPSFKSVPSVLTRSKTLDKNKKEEEDVTGKVAYLWNLARSVVPTTSLFSKVDNSDNANKKAGKKEETTTTSFGTLLSSILPSNSFFSKGDSSEDLSKKTGKKEESAPKGFFGGWGSYLPGSQLFSKENTPTEIPKTAKGNGSPAAKPKTSGWGRFKVPFLSKDETPEVKNNEKIEDTKNSAIPSLASVMTALMELYSLMKEKLHIT